MKFLFLAALLGATTTFAQAPAKKGVSVGEPPADTSPAAELASFKVLDGFQVNLFASEEDGVPNPLVIRWDERGRLWVITTTAYPQPAPGETPQDKILILEDTNHDGRVDKTTVFADGLRMPTGMELAAPGQLYVGEGEKLWLFKDTNGDDRVDEREVVLRGFGTGDTHQNINSFIWSPDGALVMHQGLHCYSSVSTPWGVKRLYGSGFWRFWPRSRKLEAYPTGMPANAWGTAFTRQGQPVMVAGAAGMFWARPMEFSVPEITTNNPQPYFLLTRFMLPYSGQIIKTNGLRKFCGVDIAGSKRWPRGMQEELITGGFFENAVFRYQINDDPAAPSGLEAVEQTPLLTSSHVAFRPVDVRFAPDGSLFIADWYDPIIGHYQASFRHPHRDKAHGRIWRVSSLQNPEAQAPAPLASGALWQHAAGDDRWAAYQAARLLACAEPAQAHAEVAANRELALAAMKSPGNLRAAALRLQLHSTAPNQEDPSNFQGTTDPGLRAIETHFWGTHADEISNIEERLAQAIADDVARVRLEAIVACGKWSHPNAIKIALRALDKPMDTFLDRALWLAVHATAAHWKPALQANPAAFISGLPPHHLAYWVEKDGSAELLEAARMLIKTPEGKRVRDCPKALLEVLARKGGPEDLEWLLQTAAENADVLGVLAGVEGRPGPPPGNAAKVLRGLLGNQADNFQEHASKLAGAWRLQELTPALLQIGGDAKASPAARIAALEALGRLKAGDELALQLCRDAAQPWPLRTAALGALAGHKGAVAAEEAAKALASPPDGPTLQRWLAPLLAREGTTAALARSLERHPLPPASARQVLAALASAGRGDPVLLQVLGKMAGVKSVVPEYSPAWVSALVAEVHAQGNAAAGAEVFRSAAAGCTACHQVRKQGGIIGPELDSVGTGLPLELMVEAVVWPNRQIKEGYVSTTLLLKDGRQLQGYRISESNGDLQLRDFLSGTVHNLPAAQIQERREAGSLMPEGLVMNLSREELRDLVAYLASLKR